MSCEIVQRQYLVTLVSGKQVTLSRSHRQQLSALKEPYLRPLGSRGRDARPQQ